MIKDENGDELTYWPISGLIEGDDSDVLTFVVNTPVEQGAITASADSRVKVWCRRKGVGATYVDISATEIDISALSLGDVEFEVYVEVIGPVSGLERVPITVTAGASSGAGWAS